MRKKTIFINDLKNLNIMTPYSVVLRSNQFYETAATKFAMPVENVDVQVTLATSSSGSSGIGSGGESVGE